MASHDCEAFLGPYTCDGEDVILVGGIWLCSHHAAKVDVYDYPIRPGDTSIRRTQTQATEV